MLLLLLIQLPMGENLGLLHDLVIVNIAAVNKEVLLFFQRCEINVFKRPINETEKTKILLSYMVHRRQNQEL